MLAFGAGMSLLQLPALIIAMLGPWITKLLGPAAIWVGLAWWLMPRVTAAIPTLVCTENSICVDDVMESPKLPE